MSSYFLVRRLIETLILPPTVFMLGMLAALMLRSWFPRLGTVLFGVCWLLLYLAHTPLVGNALLYSLQRYPPIDLQVARQADAIVVLTAGIVYDDQRQQWQLGGNSWRRMRYAEALHARTGLPLLLSGGRPRGFEDDSEAGVMQRVMQQRGTSAKWVETKARNTAESARYTAAILLPPGLQRIVLVTHTHHIPRSVERFERAGLNVLPAPVDIMAKPHIDLLAFLPNAKGLEATSAALHEYLGQLWYRWFS
ncbi:MAG: hypothetical protein ETSY1_36110 [Candidatus Entotheonella factor]|uniref:DUF218 domain-containing protein n=1 Tax=Entotheonella factor TaxID=1429438 RepID=W4L8B5_ENTF1|nr:MAG: hypothetical protein ETSY1_36110 [Candidatus Entotheonella factor]